jgi:DNA-binding MarR family transcriptional regulator
MPQKPSVIRFGVAFMLAQLGSYAAEQFASRLAEHDLTPPLAGILRMLRVEPGLSQQQLAERLGAAPSRIVSYLDDLEARGWLVRTRDSADRRINVLTLTAAGNDAVNSLFAIGKSHERRITASLDEKEHAALLALLSKLAASAHLAPGVHPGFRSI